MDGNVENDILAVIKTRRSVRKYKREKPGEELIRRCIAAACCAPSAKNAQPWSFVLVEDKATIQALSKTQVHAAFLARAPWVIVVLGEEHKSYHWLEDCSCAIMLLLLEAHALGLGACWNAVYFPGSKRREEYVRSILGLTDNYRVIANIGLGYPAEEPPLRRLKGPKDTIVKIV